jgi:hypothetical protein
MDPIEIMRLEFAKERECFLPCACGKNRQPQLDDCQARAKRMGEALTDAGFYFITDEARLARWRAKAGKGD